MSGFPGSSAINFNSESAIADLLKAGQINQSQATTLGKNNSMTEFGSQFEAFGNISKGITDAITAKREAATYSAYYKQKAQSAKLQGFITQQQQTRKGAASLGSFIVNSAAGGTTNTGSSLDVYLEGVRQVGLENISTKAKYDQEVVYNEFLAENYKFQGEQAALGAISKGFGSAANSLLGGQFAQSNSVASFAR